MKRLVPLLALVAVPAAAQQATTYYASDTWPVSASGRTCTMAFTGPAAAGDPLSIGYDAAARELTLTATGPVSPRAPASGALDLAIVFLDNGNTEHDAGWGTRRFTFTRSEGTAGFTTRFAGERNVRQILADLGNSRMVGFLHDGEAVMSVELAGAKPAIGQLEECAARAVAAN